ncbi:uncharacterized protein BXZ73DRAFT_104833 [Epithele typhae]|uniref:uncharacterized protein n=1 Tax=Epithele typhae TaxID=378194 RepID=UPI002007257D|nr:uncharacterized protein BXZ73DRAFT_104833 [Epithele typhae]KAH9920016.1 hypothetical protein BXZ73DRAFT_104833 [Epithele typhae]
MVTVTIHNTLGAAYISSIISAIFYGITTVQTATYFRRNSNDPAVFRILISILWVLDTLLTILVRHAVYTYTIVYFGDPIVATRLVWSTTALLFPSCVNDAIIRSLFMYRIWRLSNRNLVLLMICIVVSLIAIGFGLAYGIKSVQSKNYVELERLEWLGCAGLAALAFADTFFATVLCYLLSTRRTVNRKMDSIVRTLMIYAIGTGGLDAVCAIACLIAYVASPSTFINIAIYWILPKLLLNAVLVTFNARESLRDRMAAQSFIHLSALSSTAAAPTSAGPRRVNGIVVSAVPPRPFLAKKQSEENVLENVQSSQ